MPELMAAINLHILEGNDGGGDGGGGGGDDNDVVGVDYDNDDDGYH